MSADTLFYSIQEAARTLGLPIQNLRRWDEQGVLVAQRSAGGHRRYPRELIDTRRSTFRWMPTRSPTRACVRR